MLGVASLDPKTFADMSESMNALGDAYNLGDNIRFGEKIKIVVPGKLTREQVGGIESIATGDQPPSMPLPAPPPPAPPPPPGSAVNVGGETYDTRQLMEAAGEYGVDGQRDSVLAHMDPDTFASLGSDNPLNDMTGLPQAFFGSEAEAQAAAVADPHGVGDPRGYDTGPASVVADTSSMVGPTTTGGFNRGSTPIGAGFPGEDEMVAAARATAEFAGGPTNAAEAAGMSIGEMAQAKSFGVSMNQLVDISQKNKVSMQQALQDFVDARLSNNPTMAQSNLNSMTERAFQAENPGITSLVALGVGLALPFGGLIFDALSHEKLGGSRKSEETMLGKFFGGTPLGTGTSLDDDPFGVNDGFPA